MSKPELSEDLKRELEQDRKEARKYLLVWPVIGFSLIAMVGVFWKMYYVPRQNESIKIFQEIDYPQVVDQEEERNITPTPGSTVSMPTPTPAPVPIPPTNNQRIHTVSEGESLWFIANKYQVTVESIKKVNNLTSDNLQINQRLIIP